MKKKGYRSAQVKTLCILTALLMTVVAAVSCIYLAEMYWAGIRPELKEKSYEESQSFATEVGNDGMELLREISNIETYKKLEAMDASAVIDLQEYSQSSSLLDGISFENTSGLAYSVEDLLNWAQSGTGSSYTGSSYTGQGNYEIVQCRTADGVIRYMDYEDFSKLVKSGVLELSAREGDEGSISAEQYLSEVQMGYSTFCEVTDTRTDTIYTDCYGISIQMVKEMYAPQGAESILDVVNEEGSVWNGRLEEAYGVLRELLSRMEDLSDAYRDQKTIRAYAEGMTNLTYLYANKETGTVYTNKEAYEDAKDLDTVLSEIRQSPAYVVAGAELVDCDTNIELLKQESLSWWNHTLLQVPDYEDVVFALSVDVTYPIQDAMAGNAADYETYAKWMFPIMAVGILAVGLLVLSLVMLTVVAGRRPEDEEVHLCAFDRWFTEVGAAVVLIGTSGIVYWESYVIGYILNAGWYGAALALSVMIWFLIGYLSLVRRVKARVLWRNSLLRILCRALVKCLKKSLKLWKRGVGCCREFVELFQRNTASRIKMALLCTGFLFLQFVVTAIVFSGGAIFFLLLVFMDGAALVYFLRKANGRDLLLDGLKRISGGELQYKIPLEKLTGEQRRIAEYINNIGAGLDAAVESSLKNERMKTELITNVSHDIKTPLTSIINYVDLLKRENFTDPRIKGYLDILEEKAHRLKVLTEDVVEASKVSSGNVALEMVELDFVEMIQQVIGEFQEKFKGKNLTMMVHFTDEPSMIYADGQKMWRILENIFGNVEKYAMEGTRVYAEVKNSRKRVIFSLKNISAQPLNFSADELTERFIRGDVSRNTEGSGLGLSIAKSLTELQGGQFSIHLDGDLFKVVITFETKAGEEK